MHLLILLALLGTAFAAPKSVNRIVGGLETTVEEFPYIANMQYLQLNIWWTHYCGGSLLTSLHVLSAAHCYEGDLPAQWRVLLGTSQASSGGSIHSIASIIMHENYNNPTLDHNIAIVRLASNAVFSPAVQVARIPGATYNLPDDTLVDIIGWGSLSYGGAYPEQLRHAELPLVNQQVCAARYAQLKTNPGYEDWPDISDGMICAGNIDIGGKDTCDGDYGGPLAYDHNIIIGIASWGYRCADPVYPGVSTRVALYSNWIVENAV